MIDLSQELILNLIIDSFITGVLIGVLYESVRLLRLMLCSSRNTERAVLTKLRKTADAVLTFFTDLVFCLLSASASLVLTYNVSGGVFRGCVYIFMALGWLIYRISLGKLAYKLEKFLSKIIKKLLKMVFTPISVIISFFIRLYTLTIGKKLCKIRNRKKEGQKKRKDNEINAADDSLPPKEEAKNVDNGYRYRKEGRRSFGEKNANDRK